MGATTNIQWTDVSWNIARGCTKVDEDCKFCYMYRDSFDSTRYNPLEVVRTKTVFDLPLKIKEPSKIFTCSLTDFFHPAIDPYRDEAWKIIQQCPDHTFQILTKRPERILESLPSDLGEGYQNCWMGTSVGGNKGMSRIIDLLKVPTRVRFVSFEPLWERLQIRGLSEERMKGIHWGIIGGESGNNTGKYRYRPCKVEWMEEIAESIKGVSNAVFVKQMGTHLAKELKMSDRHGSNIDEFPLSLQIREFPKINR